MRLFLSNEKLFWRVKEVVIEGRLSFPLNYRGFLLSFGSQTANICKVSAYLVNLKNEGICLFVCVYERERKSESEREREQTNIYKHHSKLGRLSRVSWSGANLGWTEEGGGGADAIAFLLSAYDL